ncbi:MAG: hypothetical protein JRG91_14270 [Deltaproteobacteria bacterium]|nr:hypothetical protein [Deltaproteobacteria bacterium]
MTSPKDQTGQGPRAMDAMVQRFIDGDLTPEEASGAREMMASDPELRRDAESYRRLGDLLREAADAHEQGGELESMWEKVARRLDERRVDEVDPSTTAVWLGEFVRHRKRYWIPAAGAVAAAAATLVFVMNAPEVPDVSIDLDKAASLRSRVTDISLGTASTMVIEVETDGGGTAAILWVMADEDEDEDEQDEDGGDPGK